MNHPTTITTPQHAKVKKSHSTLKEHVPHFQLQWRPQRHQELALHEMVTQYTADHTAETSSIEVSSILFE